MGTNKRPPCRGSRRLDYPQDEALTEYEYYVDVNELALALDALVATAEEQHAPADVWLALAAAANEMRVGPGDDIHGRALERIRERMAATHERFELRELLNRWDPIGVYDPQTNFPADEYDCLEGPLMGRLRAGETAEAIENFLEVELRDHFGTIRARLGCTTSSASSSAGSSLDRPADLFRLHRLGRLLRRGWRPSSTGESPGRRHLVGPCNGLRPPTQESKTR